MTLSEAVQQLRQVYGPAEWIDTMAAYGPEQVKGFARLAEGILYQGPVPLKIKHFILFVIYLSKGDATLAKLHSDAANREGATQDEWHEVLAVFVPSRGTVMYMEGARVLGLKPPAHRAVQPDVDTVFQPKDEMLSYFKQAMGSVPTFVQTLADRKPVLFQGYFKLRSENLKNGHIEQKYKEMMLAALNTAERYQAGIEIHAKAALRCGATDEELLDAMTTAILSGGIPGWMEGSVVYSKLLLQVQEGLTRAAGKP